MMRLAFSPSTRFIFYARGGLRKIEACYGAAKSAGGFVGHAAEHTPSPHPAPTSPRGGGMQTVPGSNLLLIAEEFLGAEQRFERHAGGGIKLGGALPAVEDRQDQRDS